MNSFEARYPGTCAAAGDPIKLGDPIVNTDDGYAHDDCVVVEPPACSKCWLVHAGECM